jgi:hypothetical protein
MYRRDGQKQEYISRKGEASTQLANSLAAEKIYMTRRGKTPFLFSVQ